MITKIKYRKILLTRILNKTYLYCEIAKYKPYFRIIISIVQAPSSRKSYRTQQRIQVILIIIRIIAELTIGSKAKDTTFQILILIDVVLFYYLIIVYI